MKTIPSKIMMLVLVIVWMIAGTHSTLGQNANSGEIKGTVTDSSNAVVPGVDVTILEVGTGVVTTATTNGSGIYDVPSIPTGEYRITFTKAGFRDAVHNGITLHVGTIAVDAILEVGAASQEIVVTADAPLLQTEDSAQHMDFDAKAIQDAPIVGGVWYNT